MKSGKGGNKKNKEEEGIELQPPKSGSVEEKRPASDDVTKIEPDRIRPYHQFWFILKSNSLGKLFGNIAFGFCSALVRKWYELKHAGQKDLIDELKKFPMDSGLTDTIKRMQDKNSALSLSGGFPDDVAAQTRLGFFEHGKIKPGIKMHPVLTDSIAADVDEVRRKWDSSRFYFEDKYRSASPAVESTLASGEFSEASEATFNVEQYINHLESLEKSGHSEHGFHMLEIYQLRTMMGHSIGWTYLKDTAEYVLYDPNKGELYFKDFNKFKGFLGKHITEMYDHILLSGGR